MTPEEAIGHRIREQREELDLTQNQVGERTGSTLDAPWPRQVISSAEKGRRAFTAVELIALARALETSIEWLLTPPYGVTEVDLPSGETLSSRALPLVIESTDMATDPYGVVAVTAGRMLRETEGIGQGLEAVEQSARHLIEIAEAAQRATREEIASE